MLEFNTAAANAKLLAIHYANQVGDAELVRFMSGEADIRSAQMAVAVIEGFWKMTDLAAIDHEQGKSVAGVEDIEFWMHKLFNKVYGYMVKQGYREQWEQASDQASGLG